MLRHLPAPSVHLVTSSRFSASSTDHQYLQKRSDRSACRRPFVILPPLGVSLVRILSGSPRSGLTSSAYRALGGPGGFAAYVSLGLACGLSLGHVHIVYRGAGRVKGCKGLYPLTLQYLTSPPGPQKPTGAGFAHFLSSLRRWRTVVSSLIVRLTTRDFSPRRSS